MTGCGKEENNAHVTFEDEMFRAENNDKRECSLGPILSRRKVNCTYLEIPYRINFLRSRLKTLIHKEWAHG